MKKLLFVIGLLLSSSCIAVPTTYKCHSNFGISGVSKITITENYGILKISSDSPIIKAEGRDRIMFYSERVATGVMDFYSIKKLTKNKFNLTIERTWDSYYYEESGKTDEVISDTIVTCSAVR